jgi:di/tricarboxylate transporter
VLSSTPIVVLTAPVVKDVAASLQLSAKRYLMPPSYITILGGCCTLLGTSTNLLVDDMARNAAQCRAMPRNAAQLARASRCFTSDPLPGMAQTARR